MSQHFSQQLLGFFNKIESNYPENESGVAYFYATFKISESERPELFIFAKKFVEDILDNWDNMKELFSVSLVEEAIEWVHYTRYQLFAAIVYMLKKKFSELELEALTIITCFIFPRADWRIGKFLGGKEFMIEFNKPCYRNSFVPENKRVDIEMSFWVRGYEKDRNFYFQTEYEVLPHAFVWLEVEGKPFKLGVDINTF